jgi:hypothetical protein
MRLFTHHLSKIGLLTSLVLAATSTQASVKWSVYPYLGADAQIRNTSWAGGLGDNLFKKSSPQGNVYAGFRFCDYLGLEAGYEATVPRVTKNTLTPGSLFLGQPFPPTFSGPVLAEGKFEINGWHGSLTGFIPLTKCGNLFGTIGVAHLHARHWATLIGQGSIAGGALNQASLQSRFSNKKTVTRITGGYERLLGDCTGIRLSLGWENTNRFKNLRNKNNQFDKISIKNSWNYGLGAFTKF